MEDKIAEIALEVNDDLNADSSAEEIVGMVLSMGFEAEEATDVATYLGR